MEDKIYLHNLKCYERANEEQRKKIKKDYCFDLQLLPTKGLRTEFKNYIRKRDKEIALVTMDAERTLYARCAGMLSEKQIRAESLQEMNLEK